MDAAGLYRQVRTAVATYGRNVGPQTEQLPVPACPGWVVRDVYAHLAGVAADLIDGRLVAAGSPKWTAAQIDARRDATLDDVIDEWEARSPQLEAMIESSGGDLGPPLVGDVLNHHFDIAGAIGERVAPAAAVLATALDGYVDGLGTRVTAAGLPALVVSCADREYVVGEGEPSAHVTASAEELLRSLSGRRSRRQVEAYAWSVSATPYVEIWSAYGPLRESDLIEPVIR